MPVVSGIFLYLGRKVMSGNEFLSRIKELVADRTMLTPCSAVTRVGYKTAASYTLVQVSVTNVNSMHSIYLSRNDNCTV
jgi:HCO3- transporter family